MLRFLKRLVGIWEPKEGVIYREKFIRPNTANIISGAKYVSIYVEFSLDGVNWRPCTFRLNDRFYEIHAKGKHNRTTEILLVEKKFVKAKKIKKSYRVSEWHVAILKTDIYYRLLIKDPSKIIYLRRK
jgi:hypothetical protein